MVRMKPDPSRLVEVVSVDTAYEFLEALDPLQPRWGGYPKAWIFRGQWDSTWHLLPSAYREGAWKPFTTHSRCSSDGPEFLLASALYRFAVRLDEAGYELPHAHGVAGWRLERLDHLTIVNANELWPFVALAQHNGIPTNLLDWTRVAQFAAYFAATSSDEPRSNAKLCVWALWEQQVRDIEAVQWTRAAVPGKASRNRVVRPVSVPRSSNPNLHAQAGLFLLWQGAQEGISLDECIRDWSTQDDNRLVKVPVFYRFELPQAQAPALIQLLSAYNVDASRLFPGHAGVVKAMKEQGLGEIPPLPSRSG